MKPERWAQIEQLYHAALERAPEARAAFMDEACAEDETLRRQVAALLKEDEAAAEFQQILNHRGYAPLSPLYPLAQLGLARAARMNGNAHTTYEAFFTLWKDADQDLPKTRMAFGSA